MNEREGDRAPEEIRRKYVRFHRDIWGIARRDGVHYLTPGEFDTLSAHLLQTKVSWLVPAEEAENVR